MKKLMAMLMGCMLITSSFASCGSDKDSSDSEASTKSSKATTEAEDATEDETEDETEEETEEEPETEAPTEKPTEKATKSSGGELDSELVGAWNTTEDGYNGAYVFNADGTGDIYFDFGDMLHFEGETLMVEGTAITPDMYSFDGTHFALVLSGMDLLTMDKTTSGDGIEGTYKVKSGTVYDEISSAYAGLSFNIEIKGGECTGIFTNCFKYTADGSKITITEGNSIFSVTEFSYKIDGEEMVAESAGQKQYFTRRK